MKISFTARCPVPLNVNKPPVKTLDAAFNYFIFFQNINLTHVMSIRDLKF